MRTRGLYIWLSMNEPDICIALLLLMFWRIALLAPGICADRGRLQRVREVVVDFGTCWGSFPLPNSVFFLRTFITIYTRNCPLFLFSSFPTAGSSTRKASGSVRFGLLRGRATAWVERLHLFYSVSPMATFAWVRHTPFLNSTVGPSGPGLPWGSSYEGAGLGWGSSSQPLREQVRIWV